MDEFHKIQPSRRNGRVERKKKKEEEEQVECEEKKKKKERRERQGGGGGFAPLSLPFPSATLLVLATGKD
jgi:hypothetical protein